jgi:hypothetical protein
LKRDAQTPIRHFSVYDFTKRTPADIRHHVLDDTGLDTCGAEFLSNAVRVMFKPLCHDVFSDPPIVQKPAGAEAVENLLRHLSEPGHQAVPELFLGVVAAPKQA